MIKEMEMPEGCAGCRLKDTYYGECDVTHRKIRTWMNRADYKPDWCPLTEIKPFGPEGTLYKEK